MTEYRSRSKLALRGQRRCWRRTPRSIIGVKTHILGVGAVLFITIVMVLLDGHKSMAREWLASILITTGGLSVYFTTLLTIGVRPDNGYIAWQDTLTRLRGNLDAADLNDMDLSPLSNFDLLDDGIFGFLIAIVLVITTAISIGILVWLGANLIMIAMVVLFIPLYFVFRRGLRMVLMHSPRCHGRLGRSILIAFGYASAYALLICSMVTMMDALIHHLAR
jgi:hypothetical protein